MVKFCIPGSRSPTKRSRSTSSPRWGRSATSSRTTTPTAACAASRARSSSTGGSARSGPPPARRASTTRPRRGPQDPRDPHEPQPLPGDVAAELARIIVEAERELGLGPAVAGATTTEASKLRTTGVDSSVAMMSRDDMRERLRIQAADAEAVSEFLASPDNPFVESLFDVLDKYGGVDADQPRGRRSRQAREPPRAPPRGAFAVSRRRRVARRAARRRRLRHAGRVPARRAGARRRRLRRRRWDARRGPRRAPSDRRAAVLPLADRRAGRRSSSASSCPAASSANATWPSSRKPGGDLLAVCAAMQVIGASHVESLDTRGIDGANLMVGLETIAGYFGGIGEPNEHVAALGRRVPALPHRVRRARGAQLQHRHHPRGLRAAQARVRNEFKISVFLGVDNPWSVLWLLVGRACWRRGRHQPERHQLLELGRHRHAARGLGRARGAGAARSRALRAPRHRGLQVDRAPALRTPRRGGRDRRRGAQHLGRA